MWWKRIEAKRGDGMASGDADDDAEELVESDLGREFRKLMSDD